MKRNWIMWCGLCLGLVSCAGRMESVEEALAVTAPDNALAIGVFNVDSVAPLLPHDDVTRFMNVNHKQLSAEAGWIVANNGVEVLLTHIKDEDGFRRTLTDSLGWTVADAGDYEAMQSADGSDAVLMDRGIAYAVARHGQLCTAVEAQGVLDSLRAAAEQKPLARRKLDLLHEDMTACTVMNPQLVGDALEAFNGLGDLAAPVVSLTKGYLSEKLSDGFLTVHFDVARNVGSVEMVARSADGTPVPLWNGAACSEKVLQYMPARNAAVFATGNVNPLVSTAAGFGAPAWFGALNACLEGSAALGVGNAAGVSAEDAMQNPSLATISFIIAASCKERQTGAVIDAMATGLARMGAARVVSHKPGTELVLEMDAGQVRNPAVQDYWEDNYYVDATARVRIKVSDGILLISNCDVCNATMPPTGLASLRQGEYAFTANMPGVVVAGVLSGATIRCRLTGPKSVDMLRKAALNLRQK